MMRNKNIRYLLSGISLLFLIYCIFVFFTSDQLSDRIMWLLIGLGVMAITWYFQEAYFPKAEKAYRPKWLERVYAGGFLIAAIGTIMMFVRIPFARFVIFAGIFVALSYFVISLYFNVFPPEKPNNPNILDDGI